MNIRITQTDTKGSEKEVGLRRTDEGGGEPRRTDEGGTLYPMCPRVRYCPFRIILSCLCNACIFKFVEVRC